MEHFYLGVVNLHAVLRAGKHYSVPLPNPVEILWSFKGLAPGFLGTPCLDTKLEQD